MSQARALEWVAISFSYAWKWKVKGKSLSRVQLLATPLTAAYQAPPSMDFPGKSSGIGCHFLLQEILPIQSRWLMLFSSKILKINAQLVGNPWVWAYKVLKALLYLGIEVLQRTYLSKPQKETTFHREGTISYSITAAFFWSLWEIQRL